MSYNFRSPVKKEEDTKNETLIQSIIDETVYHRKSQVAILCTIFAQPDHYTFPSVFIFGHSATGKTYVLKTLIDAYQVPHVWINCIVAYSPRLLFEAILRQVSALKPARQNGSAPFASCDNACDFLNHLKHLLRHEKQDMQTLYLVLDKAEKLCDMPPTVLSSLLRLQELTCLNLCVILVSENSWDKFHFGTHFPEPFILHFPQYTKDELLTILSRDCPEEYTQDFYTGYLKTVLNLCIISTRNLQELRYIALSNFSKYCEPILKDEGTENTHKLWRHVAPYLKNALNMLYMRESSFDASSETIKSDTVTVNRANVELPFFSKFLLLASYIASYNPPDSDKKLFVKGFKSKRKKSVLKLTKKRVVPQHERGPKTFPLHRMLAIFYSILEEEPKPSTYLLSQISTLVSLRLLLPIGSDLDFPKYKCIVTLEFIKGIGKTVSFDIMGYLSDFL